MPFPDPPIDLKSPRTGSLLDEVAKSTDLDVPRDLLSRVCRDDVSTARAYVARCIRSPVDQDVDVCDGL